MKGKTKEEYQLVFNKLNEDINEYASINEQYKVFEIHNDFEVGIEEDCPTIYPMLK